MRARRWTPHLLLLLVVAVMTLAPQTTAVARSELMLRAAALVCEVPDGDIAAMAGFLGDVAVFEEEWIERGSFRLGARWRFAFAAGDALVLERFAPGGALRRLHLQYEEAIDGSEARPKLFALFDGACVFRVARELVYDDEGKREALYELDRSFTRSGPAALLNPPLPATSQNAQTGVRVAVVDSGVNYLLPEIQERLAAGERGEALGYDFWDMDDRPYDANPTRSPFLVQRHGTQTASLLLSEAPVATLVPYRYPRPEMSRMLDLVADARAKGVRIVNLSMGSNSRDEWDAFERAARAHPDMLFVLSAGNNDRDIDAAPVYPASLGLPNSITVTSSLGSGERAQGSNWGVESVDVAVPGEEMLVLGYDGRMRVASGSSYAAVRVSALAACLLAGNPQWGAAELKAAVLAFARPEPGAAYTAHGVLPDPDTLARGACEPARTEIALVGSYRLELGGPPPVGAHELRPAMVLVRGSGWSMAAVRAAGREAARILEQCGVRMRSVTLDVLAVPEPLKYYRHDTAMALARGHPVPRPAVYFVKDSLQAVAFDGEAIGRANSRGREALADSVWLVHDVAHPGVALAHELVHVLTDSGTHAGDPDNLMQERTDAGGYMLSTGQCERLVTVGLAHGLLVPAGS